MGSPSDAGLYTDVLMTSNIALDRRLGCVETHRGEEKISAGHMEKRL
jgi:hypothetical protein